MHKPLMAMTIIVAGTFGAGYAIGQTTGATTSFAASAAKKHATGTTVKKHTGKRATSSSAQHADGQVVAVNGNTITVKPDADKAGSNEYTSVTTINLTGSTQYGGDHGSAATSTRPTISVGQYVVAEGTVSSDGKTLTATLFSVHTGGPGHGGAGHGGPHADGTVTGVNGNVITVKADADQAGSNEYTAVTTINLTASTQYGGDHGNAATSTRPAISVGEYIVAEGTLSTDGTTLTATQVEVRPNGKPGQ